MNETQFKELVKNIKRIDDKLDTLINFARLSAPKQEPTQEEKKILELRDNQIAKDESTARSRKSS